jgi:diguanylate cyclase (GGDEF)-like protein
MVIKNVLQEATLPDLMIISLDCTHINGLQLLRDVKKNPKTAHIPVIVVSETEDTKERLMAFQMGCIDYLTSELAAIEIHARIVAHLNASHTLHEHMRLAYLDELTGLMNRRAYNLALENEWARCRRAQKPISLMIVDIDNFKHFNDAYGHDKGDELIKLVADIMQNKCKRATDIVARYGGDEFVFLLPNSNSDKAEELANVLLKEVHDVSRKKLGDNVHVPFSVSLGISAMLPGRDQFPKTLFYRADKALYEAKQLGKNKWRSI